MLHGDQATGESIEIVYLKALAERDFGRSYVRKRLMRPANRTKARKRAKTKARVLKKDPLFVDGKRPRPMFVDYKDVELLKKLTNRHGRIVGRRKSGCTAVSQHAVTKAIKRARFMALLPYVKD